MAYRHCTVIVSLAAYRHCIVIVSLAANVLWGWHAKTLTILFESMYRISACVPYMTL